MSAGPRRWLRAAFMQAEALFNRAFGDPLNPLYHLGALTFWLFWIVCGTGLFLYAFFDTSVAGAYRSVQALTLEQRFAGGIVRSVHRYASDAMVVTMLIHLARHWAFERLRGFRWFSWVTGVVLLWLVFAAGVNGYMLPWDRLAQFVTQASFEWLDWLPGFGGTLVRNFIVDASVRDRLFSLLVFIHIGVPLLTLLLMWVHVQRVPKASTQPPRVIALSVLAMLLVLALLQPVHSQGGAARLAEAPAALSFDWFLLALYPLVYAWPIGAVWALVLAASALLLAAPWLPPRRAAAGHRLTLHPGALSVPARGGETLLEAGLRAGLTLPYDCRSGGCGLCVCTVLAGRVDHGPYQPATLTEAMRARGQALMCCATALEDVELEVDVASLAGAPSEPHPTRWQGVVERMERLAPDVMRLWVALPEGRRLDFSAGQYLNIVLEDGAKRAFSFANAPGDGGRIELHVRRVPGGRFTTHVFERMRAGDPIEFEGPLGRFVLHEGERPILFVAGATGFAPIKSIVEDALRRGIRRPMWLYWGVRERADLYMADLAERWAREHENFRFVPVLSDVPADAPWSGRRGLVHEAMLADFPDLRGYELYACGSLRMIEAAVPAFVAQGLDEQHCHSDAFVPTGPR
jgi:CDP-4-dehydro-6-deoxyglucose reductase